MKLLFIAWIILRKQKNDHEYYMRSTLRSAWFFPSSLALSDSQKLLLSIKTFHSSLIILEASTEQLLRPSKELGFSDLKMAFDKYVR